MARALRSTWIFGPKVRVEHEWVTSKREPRATLLSTRENALATPDIRASHNRHTSTQLRLAPQDPNGQRCRDAVCLCSVFVCGISAPGGQLEGTLSLGRSRASKPCIDEGAEISARQQEWTENVPTEFQSKLDVWPRWLFLVVENCSVSARIEVLPFERQGR